MNYFAPQTYAATNTSVSLLALYGTYFAAPLAGTNVSVASGFAYAIGADSAGISGTFNVTAGSKTVTLTTTTGTITIGAANTTGTITIGSTNGTGTLALGLSTATQTTNIQAGATTSSNTKTINFGTGGLSGSTTTITIGATAGTSTTTLNGSTIATGTIQTQGYTVATLPAAGTVGRRAHVTDATLPTFLGTLTGGGTVKCPVFDNGTAWVAG